MTRRKFASMFAALTATFARMLKAATTAVAATRALPPGAPSQAPATPDYRNPDLSIERRTADLLRRMTLEEKVEQLRGGLTSSYGIVDPTGQFRPESIKGNFRQIYAMHARLTPTDQAVFRNALQRYAVEKTRLGIPQIFQDEGLHGYTAQEATSFPQAIALASTWDPELIVKVFTAVADEAASAGINQLFAPVLDLARDPRWGRTEETYGEDPYLCSRIGVAAIKGLQGQGPLIDRHHVIATAKHFAAHGEPQGGRNRAPANYSERNLRETFLIPFRAAVKEANVACIMASYTEIDGGVPCHVNLWLLDTVLRNEWGFPGYVTSDGGGLEMLVETHRVAADYAGAARMALAAGVDYDRSRGAVYETLVAQVRSGAIPEEQVNRAVARVLTTKFRLGLFENPYVDPEYAARITNCDVHQALALEAAQKAVILLKNHGNLLPLDLKKLQRVAVIGPNASDAHLGGYSRPSQNGVSVLDGIRKRLGSSADVLFAKGCDIIAASPAGENVPPQLPDPTTQIESIRSAAELARKSDVTILVIGGNEATCREAWGQNHRGDVDSLDLIGFQNQLVEAVVETRTPTVVFLINGRPLSIRYIVERVPAILEGWYLGQAGGTAAAQVIFGDVNPGGKLPITFPHSAGDLPAYYNHKPSAEQPYLFEDPAPLFAFGHGLSYTTFRFSNLRLSPARITTDGETTVSVDVTNTGSREGDEVAQLYIRDQISSVTRPVKELKGFQRIRLQPGKTATARFRLTSAELGFYGPEMRWVVEPGAFEIMAGGSSVSTISTRLDVV
jgi:beta-glucosidase